MSKYDGLWSYLKKNDKDSYVLSYEKIREILGFEIDHSFLTYKRELRDYGYCCVKISMKDKVIYFNKL